MTALLQAIYLEAAFQSRPFPYWGYPRRRWAEAFAVGALPV